MILNSERNGVFFSVDELKQRCYYARAGWRDGTAQYLDVVQAYAGAHSVVLDVGPGDGSGFSHGLRGSVAKLVGIDPDPAVTQSPGLDHAECCGIEQTPFADETFDLAVSSFVLEHLPDPAAAAGELFRVLKPGGVFVFRAPNLYHYVTAIARLTPHWVHEAIANRVRGMSGSGARDPYPTLYRCNTRARIRRVFERAGFRTAKLEMIEPEPSYLQFSRWAFLAGVLYERLVNSSPLFAFARVTILGVMQKPGSGE